ncbi:hypothetical protein Tcan_00568, partial [Toxocara canis]
MFESEAFEAASTSPEFNGDEKATSTEYFFHLPHFCNRFSSALPLKASVLLATLSAHCRKPCLEIPVPVHLARPNLHRHKTIVHRKICHRCLTIQYEDKRSIRQHQFPPDSKEANQ